MGEDLSGAGEPVVSVIIPVYNTEKYLEQAVGSICAQTLQNIEILAVNDGSTDGSLKMLSRMAAQDPRIKVFSQTNAGQSVARNRVMDKARGRYIYFMDSDDILEPDALELCCARCDEQQLDFVIFDGEPFCELEGFSNGLDYRRADKIEDRVYSGVEMLRALIAVKGYSVSPCLSVVRRSYMEEQCLRFYPGIIHEDELYSAQLYIPASRVGCIDRIFFHRRYHADSVMTTSHPQRTITGYMTVMRQLTTYAELLNGEQANMVHLLMRRMLNAVMQNSWQMPLLDRWTLLREAVTKYRRMVAPKSVAILMLKNKK